MLAALRERRPIEETVALVVAHPDDETLAAGGSLHLFRRLLLVHVTDGAPRCLDDAARAGFPCPAAYAAAREAELEAALALSGAAPDRVALGVPDQEATGAVADIAARLRTLFAAHGVRQVLTHCYEGGHPDHDAVALAVHSLGTEVFEFAGYHAGSTGFEANCFLKPSPAGGNWVGGATGRSGDRAGSTTLTPSSSRQRERDVSIRLDDQDLARKREMLACFHTQQAILSKFDPACEMFRQAPTYDFAEPPHPGRLLYEEWGWMSGQSWRERTRCVA